MVGVDMAIGDVCSPNNCYDQPKKLQSVSSTAAG